MNTQELAQLSKEDLTAHLKVAKEQFFHAKEQVRSGKDKNHAQLTPMRRSIAQICTILANHS